MKNVTLSDVQDSIVACRNLHGISATDESEVYAPADVQKPLVTGSTRGQRLAVRRRC